MKFQAKPSAGIGFTSVVSFQIRLQSHTSQKACGVFICIPGAFVLLLPLDWFSFLMRFAASQMRFLSENDAWYALVKENGL